jgi:hypothetical protein
MNVIFYLRRATTAGSPVSTALSAASGSITATTKRDDADDLSGQSSGDRLKFISSAFMG